MRLNRQESLSRLTGSRIVQGLYQAQTFALAMEHLEAELESAARHDGAKAGLTSKETTSALRTRRSKQHTDLLDIDPRIYDEDAWVVARDLVGVLPADRGPIRVTQVEGQARGTSVAHTFRVEMVHNDVPLVGISQDEYLQVKDDPTTTLEEETWIIRRLARSVLRVLHPEIIRTASNVDYAVKRVREDIDRAVVLAGLAPYESIPNGDLYRHTRHYLPD